MSKALIILHEGFEELEAVAPIDLLRRAEVEVTVASLHADALVVGRNRITVKADLLLDEVSGQLFDALILPGGPGVHKHLRHDTRVREMLQRHHQQGRLVAAICAGPLAVKDAGLLEGCSFTAHFSTAEELAARQPDAAVVKDGNLVTSQGAGTATEFSLALIERLRDAETAHSVAESICWQHA